MVAASGPTGFLAGRPTGILHTESSRQTHWTDQPVAAETTNRRHESDLYVRPSFTDAAIAFDQLEKGKAEGRRGAISIRARLQDQFSQLGDYLQMYTARVIFIAILMIGISCVCLNLKSVQVHNKMEQLWVQEGGDLQKDLNYASELLGESAMPTHQLVIQTPRKPDANILQVSALQEHLEILKAATQVTVELFDITWRLKDLCYAPTIPNFEMYYIDQIFEKVIPCAIITPLDCFWDGSKLLGPDYPVHVPLDNTQLFVQWTNLNPTKLVEAIKQSGIVFPFHTLEEYMKRSGITNGYQTKPCLDPMDPECPDSAPNKHARQMPDIGGTLTGGCYGFAANYMHWDEALIVGGARHNQTGHLIKAAALQSVIQLTTERELYNLWATTYKVHHIDWSLEKAGQVLDAWQRAFSNRIKKQQQLLNAKNSPTHYNTFAFSTITMNDMLSKYSEISVTNVAIACGLVLLYASLALLQWQDPVRSQAGIAVAGVVLICATIAAGLGFCALLGITSNAVTTQIVPFLVLGLGVHDMFLLTHTYASASSSMKFHEKLGIAGGIEEHTSVVLKKIGLSVLLKGIGNVSAFFAASIIPIPAMRSFSLQAAILLLFNLGAMLFIFPAMVSLDLWRRKSGRTDILCCCLPSLSSEKIRKIREKSNNVHKSISKTIPSDQRDTLVHILNNPSDSSNEDSTISVNITTEYKEEHHNGKKQESSENTDEVDEEAKKECQQEQQQQKRQKLQAKKPQEKQYHEQVHGNSEQDKLTSVGTKEECINFSLGQFAAQYYAPFIMKPVMKMFGMMLFIGVLAGSLWLAVRIDDGLELADLVPQNSDEHGFLIAQTKHFGFYTMYAVTGREFEYPNNQKLLYEYHDAFMRVKNVIKNDDGGLPKFWLSMFRDWLRGLQNAFDKDYRDGCIGPEGWHKNVSEKAIFAYKLLVQTGHVDNPIDKSLVTQVRLVDSEGIINPRGFYNYLSAWATNDGLAYGASQANLKPEPREWVFTNDPELIIPKSMSISYAQMPFYFHKLTDTSKITELISSVRRICKKFEDLGLPNFPSGIPFLYWEQYLNLRKCLCAALIAAYAVSIVVIGILLLDPWATILAGISIAGIVLQLFGVMGLFGIKLSAVSAVLLVISVGISVHFIADICLSFVTCVGASRDRRVRLALEHMFAPVIHGAITMFLGISMLGLSDFEFIVRYFFFILVALIGIGLVNGLFFVPILLSLVGPSPEVIPPHHHPDRISTPTPPASPPIARRRYSKPPPEPPKRPHKVDNSRLHTEPSLTTITEEPNSWHSTQESCIIVQPEVKVETTSTCGNQNCGGDANGTAPVSGTSHVTTTKVTATANIKVQVHTPISSGSMDRGDKCRHNSTGSSRRSSHNRSH